MPNDVFISYSSTDRDIARKVAAALNENGIDSWIDEQGIAGASHWGQEIVSAIENCKALLVLLSKTSAMSRHVQREIILASELGRHIIPVTFPRPFVTIWRESNTSTCANVPFPSKQF